MKKILFIATGGTIASKKTENGLTPQITPEELLSYIPEVEGLCEITAVNPFNLDSLECGSGELEHAGESGEGALRGLRRFRHRARN